MCNLLENFCLDLSFMLRELVEEYVNFYINMTGVYCEMEFIWLSFAFIHSSIKFSEHLYDYYLEPFVE